MNARTTRTFDVDHALLVPTLPTTVTLSGRPSGAKAMAFRLSSFGSATGSGFFVADGFAGLGLGLAGRVVLGDREGEALEVADGLADDAAGSAACSLEHAAAVSPRAATAAKAAARRAVWWAVTGTSPVLSVAGAH
jgi:hypothetical protein